jgi:hypothetical protein
LAQVFGFDEVRLADVRAELVFTRCAVDEDGQGLVWTGRAPKHSTLEETDYGIELAVRLGLHTGPVVVGAMGGGGRYEHLALGETPNIAARLEGLAAPNAVVISAVTAQLMQRAFVLEALGTQALKGITEPMAVWRVVGPLETLHEATTLVSEDVITPLVGRGEEVGLMVRRERLTRVTARCSPYHINSVLYAVIGHVQQAIRLARDDTAEEKLTKLEQVLQTFSFPCTKWCP